MYVCMSLLLAFKHVSSVGYSAVSVYRQAKRSVQFCSLRPITIAIRARFEYDSSAIQHPTRSYVLSSNNEHVNSFALL